MKKGAIVRLTACNDCRNTYSCRPEIRRPTRCRLLRNDGTLVRCREAKTVEVLGTGEILYYIDATHLTPLSPLELLAECAE